jgi:hypothetical protein
MRYVDESVIQRLEGLRPALKREWEALLRAEPTLSPLGNPDTLVYLMDETIGEVAKALRARSLKHAAANARALLVPLQRHCACGLNPLLNYYATGELALHMIGAKALSATELDEALICYHVLAQKEIDTLCGVCQHRASDRCTTPACATFPAHRH